MSTTTDTALIRALFDDLDADELSALNDTLRDDPSARAAAVRLTRIAAALHTHRATLMPQPATPHKPDDERQRIVGVSDARPQSKIGNRQSAISRPTPFIIYPISIAAAALLTAAIVVVYLLAFTTNPQPDPIQPDRPGTPGTPGPAVATLIENTGDLTTPHGFPAEGDDFSAGEYTLSGGTAEFMLTNAVNVKLRGETRLYMRDDMNVSLSQGAATFTCPRGAVGFAVQLPHDIRVVDLGTRFHVEVLDAQRVRVTVLEGAVRVAGLDEPQTLAHAQSLTIEPDRSYALTESDPSSLGIEPIAQWALSEVSSRATTPFDSALNPPSFAFEAWVRLGADRPVNQTVVMSRALWDADALHWTSGFNVYAGDSGRWEFWTGTGPNTQKAETPWHVMLGDPVEPRRWTHLVVVFDAHREDDDGVQIGTKRFYVNGRLVSEDDNARYLPNATAPFVIGGGEGQRVRPWQGDIRSVRYFDRALPSEMIEQLHADGLPAGE